MKHNNGPLIICVAWIAWVVGMAWAEVGTVYDCPSDPISGMVPIVMLVLIGVPALLAYLHGKNIGRIERESKERSE